MRSIQLEEMTWPEVKAAIGQGYDTVVFAVGATEQHGPHLPLATDSLVGDSLAKLVAKRLGHAIVGPTLRIGCSQHHMAFPGTVSLDASPMRDLIVKYGETILQHGFKRLVIIPSHGGNFQIVSEAGQNLQQKCSTKHIITYCDLKKLLDTSHRVSAAFGISPEASGAHAGEFETSILLYLHPDLVDMTHAEQGFMGDLSTTIPELMRNGVARISSNGILGDAREADGRRGEKYLAAWVDLIIDEVAKSNATA
jgi:creatinine amidohydrolase/Fe(II)-dependent formamide hydrolase-like protein